MSSSPMATDDAPSAASSSTSTKRKGTHGSPAADVSVVAAAETDVERFQSELDKAKLLYSEDEKNGSEVAQLKLEMARVKLAAAQRRLADLREAARHVADVRKWHAALASINGIHESISTVIRKPAVLTKSTSLSSSSQRTKSAGSTIERELINPDFLSTLDAFFADASVAALGGAAAQLDFDGAMNTWWERACKFKLPNGERTFAQLLSDSLAGVKLGEVAEVAPVFSSLMFELMVLLRTQNASLFLYSEANLLQKVPWPAIQFDAPRKSERVPAQSNAPPQPAAPDSQSPPSDDSGDDDHINQAADLAAMRVPPWLVHKRDGRDLDTRRKVDLAVFSRPNTRDARRCNVCAQRSVCTAIEMKRDVGVKSMRKAVSQLTQDYATTVGTQFVGERRVMFGIVGTAAELRFCQVWSDAHVRARVSPLVSIADAAEVADLLKDTNKKWCDVVASKSAFLQHIARVVLHGASGPTIDSGLKVPQGDYSVAIGNGIERIRFVGVLGCTKRSIVLSADVFDADGKTKRIAFKRYVAKASEGARRREVAALQQFGVLPGVVSLVGFGGIELNDIEWIATEPVGTALSQMCLCSSATRLAVVEALRGGPVAALQALHECNHLFADIHRGNIILTRADGGTTEESTASTTTAATSAATLRFDAKFVDLESVRAVAEEPNSPTLDITAETAEDDNKNLETVINSIESGT